MKHSLLALSCVSLVIAAKLPLRQTKRDRFSVVRPVNAGTSTGQTLSITDTQDMIYMANVTIAEQSYPVQLDTGSSDLWVSSSGSVAGKPTGLTANLTYGVGYAAGPIALAPVSFAGFSVPSQAYLAGQDVNNPALTYGAVGIVGVGFTSLSELDALVNQSGASYGRSLLYNIFALDPATPNVMTFSLQRNDDPNRDAGSGVFTIGEYAPGFAAVANSPVIPTFPPKNPSRWTILIDQIIANGKKLPVSSVVSNAPPKKAVALMDSGTSDVYVPTTFANAIYGSIPGAKFSDSLGQWSVPCDQEVDVSVVIGNQQFDVHPLDTVQPTAGDPKTCLGSWIPQDATISSDFDFLFGDAFLRSAYVVYDFGDFNQNHVMGDPYMRLLSVVNSSDASAEFHRIRGGASHNTFLDNNNGGANSNSFDSTTSGSTPDINDLNNKVNNILKWMPFAIGLAGLNGLVLLMLLMLSIIACVRRRKTGVPAGSLLPLGVPRDYRPIDLQQTAPHEAPKYGAGVRYND